MNSIRHVALLLVFLLSFMLIENVSSQSTTPPPTPPPPRRRTRTRTPTSEKVPTVSKSKSEENTITITRTKYTNTFTQQQRSMTRSKSPSHSVSYTKSKRSEEPSKEDRTLWSFTPSITDSYTPSGERLKTKSRGNSVSHDLTQTHTPSENMTRTPSKERTVSLSRLRTKDKTLSRTKYTKSSTRLYNATPSRSLSLTRSKAITPDRERFSKTKSLSQTMSLSDTDTKFSKMLSLTPTMPRSQSISATYSLISLFATFPLGVLISADTVKKRLITMYNMTKSFMIVVNRERPLVLEMKFDAPNNKAVTVIQSDFAISRPELMRLGLIELDSVQPHPALFTNGPTSAPTSSVFDGIPTWVIVVIVISCVLFASMCCYCMFRACRTQREELEAADQIERALLKDVHTHGMGPEGHVAGLGGDMSPGMLQSPKFVRTLDKFLEEKPELHLQNKLNKILRYVAAEDEEEELSLVKPKNESHAKHITFTEANRELVVKSHEEFVKEQDMLLENVFLSTAGKEGFDCRFAVGCMLATDLPWLHSLLPPGYTEMCAKEVKKQLRMRPKSDKATMMQLVEWFPHTSAKQAFRMVLERYKVDIVGHVDLLEGVDLAEVLILHPLGHRRSIARVIETLLT
eukprot:PhF_6_TR5181/c0_g1_i1/m.7446